MKKNTIKKQNPPPTNTEKITRKEALQKAGKYAALSAASMFLILSPKDSPAQSPPPPGW